MSIKPTEQKPVARPTADIAATPKPRKLSAKERKIAERDSPKVAEAKRVLDRLSESLAPEPDAAETFMVHAEKTVAAKPAEGTKVCSVHKVAEPLANFASNAAHGA